ncbi:MAG TPA: pyridoxine 5'-phosphate synthase [Coxiellaceae bacterium]|nr:pyridoxine 5'-phosphate synthase [Coxiellaceae bacterium]
MTHLSVNLNKIALIRNSRITDIPNLLQCADRVLEAGAHGITVHPRPDQRHIRVQDVFDLKEHIEVELNVEGNPFSTPTNSYPGFLALVREVKPAQCTLVPDSNDQLTSDHGWNLKTQGHSLNKIIDDLKSWGIRVSLFMDSDSLDLPLAKQIGADRIEIYTGPYAQAFQTGHPEKELDAIKRTFERAHTLGLGLNAGHDLNLHNLPPLARLPGLLEVSIGHALIVDALEQGLTYTVRAYLQCLQAH